MRSKHVAIDKLAKRMEKTFFGNGASPSKSQSLHAGENTLCHMLNHSPHRMSEAEVVSGPDVATELADL